MFQNKNYYDNFHFKTQIVMYYLLLDANFSKKKLRISELLNYY